jgi:hypothetical protein
MQDVGKKNVYTKKTRNIIFVVYTETISICNTEYLSPVFFTLCSDRVSAFEVVLSDSPCEGLGKYSILNESKSWVGV